MRVRPRGVVPRGADSTWSRAELAARLRDRREELEEAVLTRVRAIADPEETVEPGYVEGLRVAVVAAIEFGFDAVERGATDNTPVPIPLLAQARLAARSGVSLDTVLRRYVAGYSLLSDFLIEEAGRDEAMSGVELQRLAAAQASLLDRLLATVSEEHAREAMTRHGAAGQRQSDRVERLLAGEAIDPAEVLYDLAGWHVGLVARGAGCEPLVRGLAAAYDCLLLVVPREEGIVWAWLGARRALDPDDLIRSLPAIVGEHDSGVPAVALGEPGEGVPGWRLTHRQAHAALRVAQHGASAPVRYRDVATLASTLQNELLVSSLRQLYLKPLAGDRDGGRVTRNTLRAYFAADRNISSAAASLGVSRQAVAKRLRATEARLGRTIDNCGLELEIALRLDELGLGCASQPNITHGTPD